jgi:hypothetical protein
MSIGVINFSAADQSYDFDLRGAVIGSSVELAISGDFNGGQIAIYRIITISNTEYAIPQCISWTNQSTGLYITDSISGLALVDLAAEEKIRFTLIGGTTPNIKLFILGIGKGFTVDAS